MGQITLASVTPALSSDGVTAQATFVWTTDVDATSNISVTPVTPPDAAPGGNRDPAYTSGQRTYVITGLTPGADYTSKISSVDTDGVPCTYDDTAPNGVLNFTTPAKTGPADAVNVRLSASTTTLSQPVTIFVSASSSGSSVGGREIDFNIHNGDDRGSFSPNPGKTVAGQDVAIVFTPAKQGKAQIQILVDKASKNADVIVN